MFNARAFCGLFIKARQHTPFQPFDRIETLWIFRPDLTAFEKFSSAFGGHCIDTINSRAWYDIRSIKTV